MSIYLGFKKHIKSVVCFVLYYSGLLNFIIYLWKIFKKKHVAVILFYHGFKNQKDWFLSPKMNIESFEKQMRYIRNRYNIITVDDLVDSVKNGNDFDRPSIIISFDDGYRDNYDLAFKILEKNNIPAVIFLTTGLIESLNAPWIESIAYALQNTEKESVILPDLFGNSPIDISTNKKKRDLWQMLFEKLHYLEHEQKIALVADTLNRIGANQSYYRVMLSWGEIQIMSKKRVSFGSHTVTHPNLNKMQIQNAMNEIEESKKTIEKELNQAVSIFAIPNGKTEDFNEVLREYCKKIGFEGVVTTNFGYVTSKSDPYNLPRVSFPAPISQFSFELARLFLKSKNN